jgi:magnesium transporter
MLDRFKKTALAARGLTQTDSPFPARPGFAPYVTVYSLDADALATRRYDALGEGEPAIVPGKSNWVRVVGVHDPDLVKAVACRFGLHPLLVEDILDAGRRPVLEDYDTLTFILLRLLGYDADRQKILAEQVCLVSGDGYVVTFQEREHNLWDAVAARLAKGGGKLARRGQDHLNHALIAAILDEYILTLGALAEDIEELEQALLANNGGDRLMDIYRLKREVLFLHRSLWPLREVLGRFVKDAAEDATPATALLWSDIQQDVYQVLDAVETLREMLSEMVGLSMTKAELRMNAVGQYLTLVATIFLPLNFLVGFYGMNFDNLPFKESDWGVYALMGLMGMTVTLMTLFFYRKKWLRALSR